MPVIRKTLFRKKKKKKGKEIERTGKRTFVKLCLPPQGVVASAVTLSDLAPFPARRDISLHSRHNDNSWMIPVYRITRPSFFFSSFSGRRYKMKNSSQEKVTTRHYTNVVGIIKTVNWNKKSTVTERIKFRMIQRCLCCSGVVVFYLQCRDLPLIIIALWYLDVNASRSIRGKDTVRNKEHPI